jgi:hypothetical protein
VLAAGRLRASQSPVDDQVSAHLGASGAALARSSRSALTTSGAPQGAPR